MHRILAIIGTILLAGCESSVVPVESHHLVGTWGGENVQLVATATGMTFSNVCTGAEFNGPVTVADDGSFSVVGLVTESGIALNGPTHAHLSGVVSGANLIVGFYTGDPSPPPPVAAHVLTPNGFSATMACARQPSGPR